MCEIIYCVDLGYIMRLKKLFNRTLCVICFTYIRFVVLFDITVNKTGTMCKLIYRANLG